MSFKSVIQKFESDKFDCISYVLLRIQMLKVAVKQFGQDNLGLFGAYDGCYIKNNHYNRSR